MLTAPLSLSLSQKLANLIHIKRYPDFSPPLSLSLSLSLIVTYRIIPVMQNIQSVQTKCNVFEVAAVGLYEKTPLCKRSKLKWDSHTCSPNSHFVQPIPALRRAWSKQKSIKYPLRNSRIVRYNSGIDGQNRNSHNAQVQFRNCTDSHFALNIYILCRRRRRFYSLYAV